ncbi:relaxase/mobilization nuclease domain-containing protein, partial [uncultured Jannaschia sp.]|uniref:relaxase/mobilization nuclease domain-containing protein n=1 Tax=uncultured Jannaschia sp. TaxID=293347 RepID=UPI00263598DB
YLSRDGAEPLQRSEAMMGIALDAEEAARMEKEWRMPPEGAARADRTSHFIVSFPQDAPHSAAEHAGRAWAEEMFGSGQHGDDSYDYYTAFHTDRAHPHMHVVVYRRGLENGEWLKVSQRGDVNYDRMREVLV